ncbi:hypothetical protein RCL_jg872.t1 [Rhizophagus clarus]|uniref:Uncharacterized protein n=1 Tax=Rhizophagus clarus TaxID=94130 RepID=A0A8H3MJD9_9GLOM|nr:hypothetical protein RCL_jg872.t1 [Rhizophagus clarus]
MTRLKKNRINKDHLEVTDDDPKTKEFVECNCLLHCGSSTKNKPDSVELSLGEEGERRIRAVEHSSDDNDDDDDSKLSLSDSKLVSERPGRRNHTNEEGSGNGSLTDDDDRSSEASKTFADDDHGLSENEVLIEQFTTPNFDNLDYESDHRYLNTNIDYDDS